VSPALADLPFRKVNDALMAAGYRQVRVRGSHVVYRGPAGNVVVVPQHATVKRGTLASILRQAGLTPAEFLKLLK
jgi:predicted RNA binding protein YcfA (HicA-like mRNA interferase family)